MIMGRSDQYVVEIVKILAVRAVSPGQRPDGAVVSARTQRVDGPHAGRAARESLPATAGSRNRYASRRLSTQNVTASRTAARTTKMPDSMPWNAQNLLAGW